ncbi:MAG: hypothetical protein P8078_01235 [bacterium]
MNLTQNKKSLIIIAVIGLSLVVFCSLFIKIPLHISTIGIIHPQAEWKVEKTNPDEIITTLNYYLSTKAGVTKSFIFDRGDVVNLDIDSSLHDGRMLAIEDTVGIIHSLMLEDRLTEIKGNLAIAQASLRSYKSGEKQSLIHEAEQKVILEKLKVSEQETIVSRMKALMEKNLISQQEYEIAVNRLDLYKTQATIAEAQLKTISTGVKNELIEQINAEVKSYKEQLAILNNKKEAYFLTSPIKGRIRRFYNSDTLLLVQDLSSLIINSPIKLYNSQDIKIGQKVLIFSPEFSLKENAKIIRIDSTVTLFNNQQLMYTYAKINQPTKRLPPGMVVKCKIYCGHINFLKYIERIFRSVSIR